MVIPNVSWETFEALLRDRGEKGPRMAYDRGELEIMSPTSRHERLKKVMALLVEACCEEMGIEIDATGSTTFKSRLVERGLEPDESYYIRSQAPDPTKEIDLFTDPPPDLSIEIDLARSGIDQLAIYASLRIPEVWSHDGKQVIAHLLQPSGSFAVSERSAAFPDLPLSELSRFLERIGSERDSQVVRAFRESVRRKFGFR